MTNNNTTIGYADEVARTAAIRALDSRGVASASSLLEHSSPANVLAWCQWWDAQRGAGQGLLVTRIRSGEAPPQRDRSVLERQLDYGQQIRTWLQRHFPDLDRPVYGPHPAAVAEIVRLHYRYGKGALTKREHGPAIREAVEAWERKWGPDREADLPSPAESEAA